MLLTNGKFVTPTQNVVGDLLIENGLIAAIGPELAAPSGAEVFDLNGKTVMPAAIDGHVHFNEPGRADWEGWETGSRAALAGGISTVFEMPLNASPPTLTAELFQLKNTVAEEKSCVDFGLWGGLTPNNLDHIEELAEAGVIGFKAFMSNSGLDEFPRANTETLRKGMERIAKTGKILALHAEDEGLTQDLAAKAKAEGISEIEAWLTSRPVDAEYLAISKALEIAGQTGCKIHIVHISNAPGFDMVHEARAAGIDVTAETCPHYIALTDEDVHKHGALAKCAPPLRDAFTRDMLWEKVINGAVDTIGSDHSPCLTSMKLGIPFSQAWGGISGVQHFFNPFIERVITQGDLTWQRLSELASANIAERFGLKDRGKLEPGLRADLIVIDEDANTTVTQEDLLYRNAHSPYVGTIWKGRIEGTFLEGTWTPSAEPTNHRGRLVS